MTEKREVSKKEMLDTLNKIDGLRMSWPFIPKIKPETIDAIRAAIEERGRLRKETKKWLGRLLAVNAEGSCDGDTQMFLDELEIYWHNIVGDDFKLDGEGGK